MINNTKISIIIVDDHAMVIEGLKTLLSRKQSIDILACFSSAKEALEFLEKKQVDVVLLDINLPDMNGVEACSIITKKHKKVKVLGLSTYCEQSIINQMIKNGVKGYLLKNVFAQELINAIEQVNKGNVYFGAEVQKVIIDSMSNPDETPVLTRREKQILEMIAEGRTTYETADILFISPSTVETHRKNIMKKMNAPNVAALIKIAVKKGVL